MRAACAIRLSGHLPGASRAHAPPSRLVGGGGGGGASRVRSLEAFFSDAASHAYYELGEIRLRMGDLAGADELFSRAHELGMRSATGTRIAATRAGRDRECARAARPRTVRYAFVESRSSEALAGAGRGRAGQRRARDDSRGRERAVVDRRGLRLASARRSRCVCARARGAGRRAAGRGRDTPSPRVEVLEGQRSPVRGGARDG